MPKSRTYTLAVLAAGLAAATASAHGVSPWVEEIEQGLANARAALVSDPVRLKSVTAMDKLVGSKSNEKSLSNELAKVAKAAAIFESKLADQATLAQPFISASEGYDRDVQATRAAIDLASQSPGLASAARKKYLKLAGKFDKALASKVARSTPLAERLTRLSRAAKVGKGFTPYDQGVPLDWVISSLHIATGGAGVDLDGDGTADNQFGLLATQFGDALDLDQGIADAVAAGGRFALIEMWSVKNIAKPDPLVFVGVMPGSDGDADALNDFTGDGVFSVENGAVEPTDGRARVRSAASLAKGGKFRLALTGEPIQFGGLILPPQALLVVQGTSASATATQGFVGIGMPIDTVILLAASAGTPLTEEQVGLLGVAADLDLDPNVPGNDAISLSLTFTAVKATVQVAAGPPIP